MNIPLFTLGSVYIQRLVGLSKNLKQIIQIELNIVKNPNYKTNPGGSQSGI